MSLFKLDTKPSEGSLLHNIGIHRKIDVGSCKSFPWSPSASGLYFDAGASRRGSSGRGRVQVCVSILKFKGCLSITDPSIATRAIRPNRPTNTTVGHDG